MRCLLSCKEAVRIRKKCCNLTEAITTPESKNAVIAHRHSVRVRGLYPRSRAWLFARRRSTDRCKAEELRRAALPVGEPRTPHLQRRAGQDRLAENLCHG